MVGVRCALRSFHMRTLPKSIHRVNRSWDSFRGRRASSTLPKVVQEFVDSAVDLCSPADVHIVTGSELENQSLIEKLISSGTLTKLTQQKNSYLARTDPLDVARVESKTFICTENRQTAIPTPAPGVKGQLGNWMSLDDVKVNVESRFRGSMKNRTMFVIPFSMGPLGSPFSKIGVQLTDSPYVVVSMRIMTRIGDEVWRRIDGDFVRALHSVGSRPGMDPAWPCDPERTLVLHKPEQNEIISYGSGYGGNSLLGKKCLALRIGSRLGQREGWLAEHMLILGLTRPGRPTRYIAAAFPSACGKTNLAMMRPALPGYKVHIVGDDIAWIRYNPTTRMFHAINPEFGFFGVAPGTNHKTNPNAMATLSENSIFTNTGVTSKGGIYWEGMDLEPGVTVTDWRGQPWSPDSTSPAAHPNSRFTSPASQCPILDPNWESPEGVPISAILFGGRRPQGVPLVYEAYDWDHGVFVGASMRSEATAAAEHKGKVIMNDPFAMRPFFGYNFGHYLSHWLSMRTKYEPLGAQMPKIFHVNWFRKGAQGEFLWPGFGENVRILDWILNRVEGKASAVAAPIGYLPTEGAIDLTGLDPMPNMCELLRVPEEFWRDEVKMIEKYLTEQVTSDLPIEITKQIQLLKQRLHM